jgi:hypothetical protein
MRQEYLDQLDNYAQFNPIVYNGGIFHRELIKVCALRKIVTKLIFRLD